MEKKSVAQHKGGALGAQIEGAGVLVFGGREAQLFSRESALVAVLLERFPNPLRESEFSRLLWPVAAPSESTRRASMVKLRRRLATVGLALRCRARVGYTLEESPWVLDITSAPGRVPVSTRSR